MSKTLKLIPPVLLFLAIATSFMAYAGEGPTLEERYPDLVSGVLQMARLSALSEGELLRINDKPITHADFEKAPFPARESESEPGVGNDALFRLEEFVMIRLVRQEMDIPDDREMEEEAIGEMFRGYIEKSTADITVTEEEMRAFYEEVKAEIDAEYEDIKPQLQEYMAQNKKREAFTNQLDAVSQRASIRISEPWVEEQVKRLRDNEVDKARAAGLPLLVDFSAEWCPPCQRMKPVIAGIQEKYAGKLTVLVVDVDKNRALAQMYKVESIPLLLFFDKEGKQVHRQEGALNEEEIVAKLKDIGVS